MSKKETGLAFPLNGYEGRIVATGMTLRDWFAGMALQGYIAGHSGDNSVFPECGFAAKRCYDYADAMLKARAE
jgi:hypothetical protein